MTQDPSIRLAISSMGTALGPEVMARVSACFAPEHSRLAVGVSPTVEDASYGPHPRHGLDLYCPPPAASPAPVLLWVHGGGFVRGEKRSPDHPFNAHVGRWAARCGLVGAVMNYRLLPEAAWPSGGEDVGMAVDWLRRHVAAYGGDASRIVVVGTSAGSVHIATYLKLRPDASREIAGAVLLSGLYGTTPPEGADSRYFGSESGEATATCDAVAASAVPLLVASAEFDPPRFQTETLSLLQRCLAVRGALPRAHFASGHNHYSMAQHLGTADTRLTDEILAFIADCAPVGA